MGIGSIIRQVLTWQQANFNGLAAVQQQDFFNLATLDVPWRVMFGLFDIGLAVSQ